MENKVNQVELVGTGGRGIVKKKKQKSLAVRAGTIFPVGRIRRYLKACTHQQRIAIGAPVYQAAVMEYLSAEILELAGNAAQDNKKRRITPRHILLAVGNDQELNKLLKNVTIPSGGVMPHIAPELLKNKVKGKFQYPSTFSSAKSAVKTATNAKVGPHMVTKKAKVKVTPIKTKLSSPKKVPAKVSVTPVQNGASSPVKTATLSEKMLFLGQKLTVVQGDISTMICDAVVHPTNGGFNMTGQVGAALSKVGGAALSKCVSDLAVSHGSLDYATALIGDAPGLNAKYIIHVHSPSWGKPTSEKDLETVVKNSLSLADEKNVVSIAFPSIGSGVNNFPKQVAAQTILKSISNYFVTVMASTIKQVIFVLYDMESIAVYTTELAKMD